MTSGGRSRRGHELGWFYLATALALLTVALGAVFVSESVAREQALSEAERSTQRLADLVVAPLLGQALTGDQFHRRELDEAVKSRLLDGYLTEVTVWSADGTVVYANEPQLIGTWVAPTEEISRAIAGTTTSAYEDDPEADYEELDEDTLGYVEVYVPLRIDGQPPMAFEAYYDYARVHSIARTLLMQTLPVVLIPLVLLQAIQLPIAISLCRRARRHERERTELYERALRSSEQDRARFAGDLHDGPIQDLAGVGYVLGAVALSADAQQRPLIEGAETALRRSIASLRGLMTDLYPPDVTDPDLERTVSTLAHTTLPVEVDVVVAVDDLPPLAPDTVATVYRMLREVLVNVSKHAHASSVTIGVSWGVHPPLAGESLQVRIVDDGLGADPDVLSRRTHGHLGLRLVEDRLANLGGNLTVRAGATGGTEVVALVPGPVARDHRIATDQVALGSE